MSTGLCYICKPGADLKRTLTRKEARICFKVWQIWKTRFNRSRITNTFQAYCILKGCCQVDLGPEFWLSKTKGIFFFLEYQIFRVAFYNRFIGTVNAVFVNKLILLSEVTQVKFRFYIFGLNVSVLSRCWFYPTKRVANPVIQNVKRMGIWNATACTMLMSPSLTHGSGR